MTNKPFSPVRKSLDREAHLASGRSRMCKDCPFRRALMADVCDVCDRAFVEGFKKGAKYIKNLNK